MTKSVDTHSEASATGPVPLGTVLHSLLCCVARRIARRLIDSCDINSPSERSESSPPQRSPSQP